MGSEMCIRDSGGLHHGGAEAVGKEGVEDVVHDDRADEEVAEADEVAPLVRVLARGGLRPRRRGATLGAGGDVDGVDVDGGLLIPSGGPVGRGAVVGHCDGAPTALGEAGVEPLRVRDVGAPGGPHDV